MTNRIILPANYTVDIIVKFDPYNGQTELHVKNRSNKTLSMLQIAGILSEHAAVAVRNVVTGQNVQIQPIQTEPPAAPPNGGTPNAS